MDNIDLNIYRKEDYTIGQWQGGMTTELAIYPPTCQYGARDFLWRLSSATVDVEESDFTSLPDYDRILIVLKGEVVLVHKDMRAVRLAKYEQDRFSGAYETQSFGKITDFNLMVRKGSEGFAEVITLTEEHVALTLEKQSDYERVNQGFYCAEGFGVVSLGGKNHMIKQGELLIISGDLDRGKDFSDLGIMGQGKIIRSQVYFNKQWLENPNLKDTKTAKKKEIIAKEQAKPTLADLKWAALICWSNFRGGTFVFRCMRNLWFDNKLQRAINRLENTYLTYIIALIGFGAAGFGAIELWGNEAVFPISVAWLALDILILNPLLHLKWLPKPIAQHIKDKSEMTEEDKIMEANRRGENIKAEKILKKYEISGRNKYID